MLQRQNPTHTAAWKSLESHYQQMKKVHLKDLFQADPNRFKHFSLRMGDLLVDYSKNIITDKTMQLLYDLANETKLQDGVRRMFEGDMINETEGRSVLHVALRNRSGNSIMVNGEDVMPEVNRVLDQMRKFVASLHNGNWTGYTGKKITDVVNIRSFEAILECGNYASLCFKC